jgi:hypothetical protein
VCSRQSRCSCGCVLFYLEKRIRTFVYLSSAKLEPLYHQIKEPARKRIALTLGISFPVLPIAPKVEAEIRQPTTNETDMLSIVLSHLDDAGASGYQSTKIAGRRTGSMTGRRRSWSSTARSALRASSKQEMRMKAEPDLLENAIRVAATSQAPRTGRHRA